MFFSSTSVRIGESAIPGGKMYFIRRIDSPSLLVHAQRLRAEIYLEEGFLGQEHLTDGLDVDGLDSHSVLFGAYDLTGDLVGTIRMILPDIKLPVTTYFGIETDSTSVEVSRFVIRKEHRGVAAALGLCRAICSEVHDRNLDKMYATMEDPLIKNLIWLGFPFQYIGEPTRVMNTLNFPTLCLQSQVAREMSERDEMREFPKTSTYFGAPFNHGGAVSKEMFKG